MNINKVGSPSFIDPYKKVDEKPKETKPAPIVSTKPSADTFIKEGEISSAGIYNKSGKVDAQQMMKLEQQRTESFTRMLQSMVVKQGQKSNLTLFGMDLFVTPEDSAKAAASIADGGEYSVDAVATRIMDMAKALSGGDSANIEKLRKAVQKGFEAAGVEFGGELPEISNNTYDEVMKRFDDWANESKE